MTRGFAKLDAERRREIARLGGKSTPKEKRNFALNRELASRAGAKGGRSKRRSPEEPDAPSGSSLAPQPPGSFPLRWQADATCNLSPAGDKYCVYFWLSSSGLRARQREKRNLEKIAIARAGSNQRIIARYVEPAGLSNVAFPQLAAALVECQEKDITLLIPSVARLSSNVVFLEELTKSQVDFVMCELPEVNRHNIAAVRAVAAHAARTKGEQIRKGMAQMQMEGRKRNSWRSPLQTQATREKAKAALIRQSDEYAQELSPILDKLIEQGVDSYHALAKALTQAGVPTRRGLLQWHPISVARLLKRLKRNLPEGFVSAHRSFAQRATNKPPKTDP